MRKRGEKEGTCNPVVCLYLYVIYLHPRLQDILQEIFRWSWIAHWILSGYIRDLRKVLLKKASKKRNILWLSYIWMNGPNEENNLDQLTCTVCSFRSCEPFRSPALELTCNTSTACICFPRCIKEPLHFRRYSDHSSDDGPHGPDGSAMPNMQKPFHMVR